MQHPDWPMFDGDFQSDTNQAYNGDQDVYGTPEQVIHSLSCITDPAGNC